MCGLRPDEAGDRSTNMIRLRLFVGRFLRLGLNLASAALAGALLLAVAGQCLRPNFQTAGILFDLPMPAWTSCLAQTMLAAVLLINPRRRRRRSLRRLAMVLLAGFALFALIDTSRYYWLWASARIVPRRWFPLSLYLLAILAVRLGQWSGRAGLLGGWSAPRLTRRLAPVAAAALLGAFGLPLVEQLFFGSTGYPRRADVIVVLGAGVLPDGRPSDALRDRVLTAAALHRGGLADRLLMTGGTDPDHGFSEPAVMRDLAIARGVPPDAIILDQAGNNTLASVRNLSEIMREHRWRDCLVVSHDFHLPRIKRLLERRGIRSCTVPADERWPLSAGPLFRLREVAAWHYYLLALPGR